jgi:hypothetical protein
MNPPTNALDLLTSLIADATGHLAKLGRTIGIVLAPSKFVFSAFEQAWHREHGSYPKGDHTACMLVHGSIVLGADLGKKHPHHGKITIWADSQFNPPAHDALDKDDHAHKCPIFKPCPDGDTHPLERAMWDIQMSDWLGSISATVTHMLSQEPAFAAELAFQPEQPQ